MAAKLGIRFWTNLLLSFVGGATAGFVACRLTIGATERWFIFVLVGLGFGIVSGYGILFRFHKPEASESAIGRYAFWPGLMLGLILNLDSMPETGQALTITFSSILGFMALLISYLRSEFREKKEIKPDEKTQ